MIFTYRRTSSPAAKTGGRRGEVGGGAGLGTEVALWAESHRAVAGGLTAECATSEGPPVVVDVSLASKTLYAAKNSSSVSFCVICSAADDSKSSNSIFHRVTESFCVEDFVMETQTQWLLCSGSALNMLVTPYTRELRDFNEPSCHPRSALAALGTLQRGGPQVH